MKTRWLVSMLLAWFIFVGGSDKPSSMLRFHIQTSPKFGKENIVPVTLANPAATIFIGKLPDLDESFIQDIEVIDGGKVLVTFNEAGKKRLEEITRANIEAILVVICNGRVVYAPIIDMVISSGKFVIPQGITPQDIQDLKKIIPGLKEEQNPSNPRLSRRNVRGSS